MNLLGGISEIIKPVTQLIDNLHTSEEEKQEAKEKIFRLQSELFSKALEYEKAIIQSKAEIIKAEAQGQGWLQRSWRPITMFHFLILLTLYWFGLAPDYLVERPELVDSLFDLLQIGIGGYIVSRSGEKVAKVIGDIKKEK